MDYDTPFIHSKIHIYESEPKQATFSHNHNEYSVTFINEHLIRTKIIET